VHEEALVGDLRRKLTELGATPPGGRITRATVRVGALAHLSAGTLRARWATIVAGTPAEGAALDVEEAPDPSDPRATGVVLVSVVLDDGRSGPGAPAAPKRG